ncbi:dephospho-CoA kinase [Ethanoligenens harbinense]|uniref:Dephospho-CoA kinase n=1 Tax=Ethanoligenens harbinense (strain DSM 18485 / JCM 12961 / CGMCC 1.5033 / YUAN-3) TaxID=663278 RepID=E6U7T8_ETHHY|nr:dephospho-CoA kinase [Ethanoligenens harbinense]ADU28211.1 dephospho-CoA kinase [Ethanoligenens harbinense YUAN-3]AVQ97207.1 dephospho-CoA kinase [Ethanoligenens harbinense YUAN-3]AYF39871.1 dephospho-CoA kinase [Ethanoligenens harbinense]AYF42703.1 dephospho-CoA kinase [Ethanoligenens harbinense]QCN93453.1 dephospho-CoA kinase [Ethanoligenens harbinense]
MVILGLTGPTGAGKGFVSQRLAEKGFAVVDADRVAHDVMAAGTPCVAAIAQAFGPDVLRPDGSLNRRALGALVFSDPEKLRQLNALSHPPILAQIKAELDALTAAGYPVAVVDAPTLFECGVDRLCDRITAVTAEKGTRLARIMARDGLDESRARQRIAAQPDTPFYTTRADDILENNGNIAALRAAVDELAERLLTQARAEERPCTEK